MSFIYFLIPRSKQTKPLKGWELILQRIALIGGILLVLFCIYMIFKMSFGV